KEGGKNLLEEQKLSVTRKSTAASVSVKGDVATILLQSQLNAAVLNWRLPSTFLEAMSL
ncbi:MAG: hypothetical protein H7258_00640, partial [Ferruginibacter sp.]|nr:hypothetical protein [Ferruginibacter sp.]